MNTRTLSLFSLFAVLSVAACSDSTVRLPKVAGGIEVPDEVLAEPRVVPSAPPMSNDNFPLVGNVPNIPKNFTPQPTIDATKREMEVDRDEARQLQQNYQATAAGPASSEP